MRKPRLYSVLLLILIALPSAMLARTRTWTASGSFTPPPEPGNIFTVINYDHSGGRNQVTVVNVTVGDATRKVFVAPPYRTCADAANSGFVLRVRHRQPDQTPVKITTTGTIVRGPYQGDLPLELLSACYKLVS